MGKKKMEKGESSTSVPLIQVRDGRKPHFFKKILPTMLESGRLRLPPEFAKHYGKCLSNTTSAQLEAPTGETWTVEVKKCNGRVWLGRGWLDFTKHYSVKEGYFLLFRYRGISSLFRVFIYDATVTEIEYYPIGSAATTRSRSCIKGKLKQDNAINIDTEEEDEGFHSNEEEEKKDERASVDKLKHFLQSKRETRRSSSRKELHIDDLHQPEGKRNDQLQCEAPAPAGRPQASNPRVDVHVPAFASSAKSFFKCDKPSTFMITMKPSHVAMRCNMTIPANHFATYLKNKVERVVYLHDGMEDGRTWPVKYYQHGRNSAKFSSDFRKFVLHHLLKAGDVCIFELLHPLLSCYKVTVFHAST